MSHMFDQFVQYSLRDIIISLPSHVVDGLIDYGVHEFPQPWLYFPPIPPHIRRAWVYETGAEGITIMISFNQQNYPNHIYFLTNPLYAETMEMEYHFNRNLIPRIAPLRILCRFQGHLMRVW